MIALLACSLLVACSGATIGTRAGALRESVTRYVDAMRWGRVELAALHVPDEDRDAFIRQKRMAQAQVQIHEYELRGVDHVVGTDRAKVVIAAVWSRPADPVIHNEMVQQEWRWLKDHWAMVSQETVQPGAAPQMRPGDAL